MGKERIGNRLGFIASPVIFHCSSALEIRHVYVAVRLSLRSSRDSRRQARPSNSVSVLGKIAGRFA